MLAVQSIQLSHAQWPPPAPTANDWKRIGTQRSGPFDFGATVSAVGPSGGIYVAGRTDFSGRRVVRVARWNFGSWLILGDRFENGTTNVEVYAIAVDASGNVYVSGDFLTVYNTAGGNPLTVNRFARWNVQTNAWEAVGGGVNTASCIAVLGTDVYVGGTSMTATNPGGGQVILPGIGFWSTTTNTWSPVGQGFAGGFNVVMSMMGSPAGVYVGGSFLTATNPGGGQVTVNHIALWTGTQWQPLGQGLGTQQMFGPYASNLALNAANELCLGGVFQTARNSDNTTVPGPIVRWNGTVWSNETAGLPQLPAGTTFLYHMVIDGSDALCVYYYDGTIPGNVLSRRVAPGQWQRIGRFSGEIVRTLAGRTGRTAEGLYVGGLYNRIVDLSTNSTHDIINNAQWLTGTGWMPLMDAGGVIGTVRALASTRERPISGEDFLYAGGSFTSIANVAANNIGEYDGRDWRTMGGGVNGPVYAIVADRGGVYVGGSFTVAYNPDGSTVNVQNIALWNKQFRHWEPFNGGVTGPVYALEVYSNSGGSPRLFVGGSFNQAYDGITTINANSIVEFWTQFGGPFWEVRAVGRGVYGGAQEVRAIARHGDRYRFEHEMYLGGSFTGVVDSGGIQIPTSNIARWNIQTNTWRAVGRGVNGTVRALAYDFGDLPPVWVGGDFTISTNENGSTVNTPHLALWNDASNQWNILQGGTNGPVHAIARINFTHYNGAFVGGNFTLGRYENGNTRLISRVGLFVRDQFPGMHLRQYWNGRPDTPDPALNGVDGPVHALLSLGMCSGAAENLYAGGDFVRAGNTNPPANGIARWNYKWQPGITGISASGGVRSSGGGNSGRGIAAEVRLPACSPLVLSPRGEPRLLFDSLGFRQSVQLDGLPFLEHFRMEVYREGATFSPIYVKDSLFLSSASPGLLAFIGVDDTLDFAPNPDGRPTEFRVIAKPLPIDAGQEHLARVVFLHAISDAPAINISIQGGNTLVQNLPYGETADSTVGLPPGNYMFDVRRTGNNQLIGSFAIDLSGQAGQIAVVAATGFLDPAANQNGPAASLTEFETGTTILTDINDPRKDEALPASFALYQNYPNPFNPSTTIKFEIPISGQVSLLVYNILGQEVARLVEEVKSTGNYTVTWNADGMASGVYFCRLQAGGFVQTRKMLLTK